MSAAIALLSAQLPPPALVTVQDADDRDPPRVGQAEAPALLFAEGIQAGESSLAVGLKSSVWYLDAHLWAYSTPVLGGTAPFRTLVNQIVAVYRSYRRLGGGADVPGISQLLSSAEAAPGTPGIRTQITSPIRKGGTAVRHALISVRLEELFFN